MINKQYPDFAEINAPLSHSFLSKDCLHEVFRAFKEQAKKKRLCWDRVELFIVMHPDIWNGGKENVISGHPVIFDSAIKKKKDVHFLITHVFDNFVMWGQRVTVQRSHEGDCYNENRSKRRETV